MRSPPAVTADARTFRSFIGLAGGEAIARLLAFVAMLVAARRLGPAMYGVIGVASGIMLYLNQVADAGVELSGVPAVARQKSGLTELVSSTLTVRLIIALSLTVIVGGIGVLVAPQPDGAILALYALGLVFVGAGVRWVFLGQQRSSWVAVARIGGEFTALAIIFLALHNVGDVFMVPLAAVIGAAVASTIMLGGLRAIGVRPVVSVDWRPSRELFARSTSLVGFTILGLVLFNADLIYLRFVSGEAVAGYYAAAYTFVAFSANLSVAWAHSVMPAMARPGQPAAERSDVYGAAVLLAFVVALPIAAGGMLIATSLIRLVFGLDYLPAVPALVWLLPAVPIAAMREVVMAGLIASDQGERDLIRINAVSALFNIVLLIPVVSRFGAEGAAAVTVLTEVLRLAVAVRAARLRGFDAPRWARFAKPTIAAAAMVSGLLLLREPGLVISVVAGGLLYGATLIATGVVRFERPFRPRIVL